MDFFSFFLYKKKQFNLSQIGNYVLNLCGGSGGDGSGNGVRVSGVSDVGIRVSGVSVACIVGGSVPGVGNLRGCNGNGCSGDIFMNVCLSCDIFMNVGFSSDIFMNVCLSCDIFMNVGDGGGVNLTSIIVGVDNVVDNRGGGISGNVSVSCRGSGISSMVSGESCIGT